MLNPVARHGRVEGARDTFAALHCLPFLRLAGRVAGRRRERLIWHQPLHVAARHGDPRTEDGAGFDLLHHGEVLGQARHQPHAGHTIGEQYDDSSHRWIMDVHVPQPRDHELAGAVHDLGPRGHRDVGANVRDAVPRDDHGRAGLRRGAGTIDDRHVVRSGMCS
jgi:hypothetical protein